MKIKIIANRLSGKGGTEAVIKEMMIGLPIYAHHLELSLSIVDNVKDTSWLDGLDHITLFNHSWLNKLGHLGSLVLLLQELTFSKEDIVILTSPTLVKIAGKTKKILRKKYSVVSWLHYSLDAPIVADKKHFLLKADYHFAIATGIKKQFEILQGHSENVFTILNPVKEQKMQILKPTDPIFLCVGRLSEEKNNLELLEAATHLPQGKKWSIHFYGDGDQRMTLMNYVIENGLCEKVKFKGWHDNPWCEIKEATALVMTSHYEGFGLVLAEAIARGIPCISSDCPVGPQDIITDENGFLYPPRDISRLVEIMNLFLENAVEFKKVKESISPFYEASYFNRLCHAFTTIEQNKIKMEKSNKNKNNMRRK